METPQVILSKFYLPKHFILQNLMLQSKLPLFILTSHEPTEMKRFSNNALPFLIECSQTFCIVFFMFANVCLYVFNQNFCMFFYFFCIYSKYRSLVFLPYFPNTIWNSSVTTEVLRSNIEKSSLAHAPLTETRLTCFLKLKQDRLTHMVAT